MFDSKNLWVYFFLTQTLVEVQQATASFERDDRNCCTMYCSSVQFKLRTTEKVWNWRIVDVRVQGFEPMNKFYNVVRVVRMYVRTYIDSSCPYRLFVAVLKCAGSVRLTVILLWKGEKTKKRLTICASRLYLSYVKCSY